MNQDLTPFAEALVFVHGSRAEWEAARQAELCERTGDKEFAAMWRRLQRSLRDLRPKLAA